MFRGEVVSIHVTAAGGAPMEATPEVRALAGVGLEGDRYATGAGTYSKSQGAQRQVTLIEIEAVEALERDLGLRLSPGDSRRNIVTRGVPLNHLVGVEFRVGGEVLLRGVRLNAPCRYFEGLVGIEGVFEGLLHRSGLNAEVLAGGIIRAGDAVEVAARQGG
ncbi:MAG: MOSC domain-containing protein [bacterium]